MLPYFTELYGNAASTSHRFGWEASEAVDRAREQVAAALGANAREIIFTSGATESNNLAIKGVAQASTRRGKHLVTAASEHKAVLDPDEAAGSRRMGGHRRSVRRAWMDFDPAAIADALTDRTVLVSVMAANNEVGTLNPIDEIGQLVPRTRRRLSHRCRPGRRQGALERRVRRDRPSEHFWTQSLCSQRDRCVVRPPERSADPDGAAA